MALMNYLLTHESILIKLWINGEAVFIIHLYFLESNDLAFATSWFLVSTNDSCTWQPFNLIRKLSLGQSQSNNQVPS